MDAIRTLVVVCNQITCRYLYHIACDVNSFQFIPIDSIKKREEIKFLSFLDLTSPEISFSFWLKLKGCPHAGVIQTWENTIEVLNVGSTKFVNQKQQVRESDPDQYRLSIQV